MITDPTRGGDPYEVRAGDGALLYGELLGAGPALMIMHGGGDRESMRPLAQRLATRFRVILTDVRGYGRSICREPGRHTWSRYVADLTETLRHLEIASVVLVGAGLGGTIALRAACAAPSAVDALVIISPEDIEDDEAKLAETELMDRFADLIRTDGLEAAWQLYLPHLSPLIASIVRESLPRADPRSAAAAAAIGRDRSFRSVEELAAITCPVLVMPGEDDRHPDRIAREIVSIVSHGQLSDVGFGPQLRTTEDLADAVVTAIEHAGW